MGTVTIWVSVSGRDTPVEMPGATTGLYAAKRAAEAFEFDPDAAAWHLADPVTCQAVPLGDVIAPWDGKTLLLGLG